MAGKTAILVDGGFYRKRARQLWGEKTPAETADGLFTYCKRHLSEHGRKHDLYRIFYYDCPPIEKQLYHPLLQRTTDLSRTPQSKWMKAFLEELKQKRKVALRLGILDDNNSEYQIRYIRYDVLKKLCAGKIQISDLSEADFQPNIKQKGVDMKIGVDIASLAYKKQVDQIVLIAGDSDFVPAAKLARREGVDFVLDSLNAPIKEELFEHIDGLNFRGNPYPQDQRNETAGGTSAER